MSFEHKFLICIDCSEEFVFTADSQEYFAQKRRLDDPKRCKWCHIKMKKASKRDLEQSPGNHVQTSLRG